MIDECENLESGGFGLEDILSLDATGQLQALAALRISARELLEASAVRTDRLNPMPARSLSMIAAHDTRVWAGSPAYP